MNNFIVYALICDVGFLQTARFTSSYKPPKQLSKNMKAATEGAEALRSLIEAVEQATTDPDLQQLTASLPGVFHASQSIGVLFSQTRELISGGQFIDIETFDHRYKEIDISFDQLVFNPSDLQLKDHEFVIFDTYSMVHDRLEQIYHTYREFVENLDDISCASDFVYVCEDVRTEPAGLLANIHATVTAVNMYHRSNFMEFLRQISRDDVRVSKHYLQIITKDVARAVLLHQACLGIKNINVAARSRAAESDRTLVGEIIKAFSVQLHLLTKGAIEQSVKPDIDSMVNSWRNEQFDDFTTKLKNFLVAKYPWLLWNVFVYELGSNRQKHMNSMINDYTMSDDVGIAHQTHDFKNLMTFFKGDTVVGVTWAEMYNYENQKFWIHTYRMQMEKRLRNDGCLTDHGLNFKDLAYEYPTQIQDIPFVFGGENASRFATDIADNAVEFQICHIYVAAVVA